MVTIKDGDTSVSEDWTSVDDTIGGNCSLGSTGSPNGGSGYNGAGCFEAVGYDYISGGDCGGNPSGQIVERVYTKTFDTGLDSLQLKFMACASGGADCYCYNYPKIRIMAYDATTGGDWLLSDTPFNQLGGESSWASYDVTYTDDDFYTGGLSDVRRIEITCEIAYTIC